MGSYLSEPITEKVSSDSSNDRLICGTSSMQGWRVSQEVNYKKFTPTQLRAARSVNFSYLYPTIKLQDAHNCLLDFDKDASLFAVYDGHGGQEVAQYASDLFPNFLKTVEAYKKDNMKEALIDAFLGFDNTIVTPEGVEILKGLVATDNSIADESDEEENVNHLFEEANMPIELVIEKYTSNLKCNAKNMQKDHMKKPSSPCLKAQKSDDVKPGSSNVQNECSSSSSSGDKRSEVANASDNVSSSSNEVADAVSSNTTEKGILCYHMQIVII